MPLAAKRFPSGDLVLKKRVGGKDHAMVLMVFLLLRRGKKVLFAKTKGWDGGVLWFLPCEMVRFSEDPNAVPDRIVKEWFGARRVEVQLTAVQQQAHGRWWFPSLVFEGKAPAKLRNSKDILEAAYYDLRNPPEPLGFDARSVIAIHSETRRR